MSVRLLHTINKKQKNQLPILYSRCFSIGNNSEKGEHLKPPGGLKTYIVKKYVSYIERCQVKAKEDYPKFYKIYRLFKDAIISRMKVTDRLHVIGISSGIVDFFNDTKLYSVIATRIWAGQDLTSYVFPRQLLCHHFWTEAQKEKFGIHYLRERLRYYPHIVEMMERQSVYIQDVTQRRLLQEIMFKLEHGRHPTVEELLEVKPLFINEPFGLSSMSKIHRWYLARSLSFSTLYQSRFKNDAILLHNIDLALIREGLNMLSMEQLKSSCFYRGFNAEGQTEAELKTFLKQWLQLSQELDEKSLSLLLHAPVLLSYNKPSNRKYLIHDIDIRGNVLR
ncbi:hypothetical protein LSH36_1143g00033 [Paralvinella palmiformis]|uniref:Letm1 RBD domain-containing protein n=1 Tax=Paralvinella palmiformis TaxID=53620 RepID=A0AAD9MRI5_9ANNE|nr:hypothetical protein LSH36_1143g00033 [Paralvinella palmiformis]